MDKLIIESGNIVSGRVDIAGAKNAALPLMAATLLTDEQMTLTNIPNLSDITTMANLLISMGAEFTVDGTKGINARGRRVFVRAQNITSTKAPYDIVKRMRASVVVLGPLIARFGEAQISYPGGCAIGARPINFHLDALEKMGVQINLSDGYIETKLIGKRLKGAEIEFPMASVGATENILMAATLADGKTTIRNAACEPEITDLANMLNKMGAKISGIGTSTLVIEGVEKLHGCEYSVVADRIEAGTYACVAAITGGEVELANIGADVLHSTIVPLQKMGVEFLFYGDVILVKGPKKLKAIDLITEPHPGFPTDMQAQFCALCCVADGNSSITETIFENRFMHVPELFRMGTKMKINGNRLDITGNQKLKGAEVMATDLRASVSLVLAALVAEGKTSISRVYHLDRGYERIEEKLGSIGVKVLRVRE
jgi:UDP-N-acetylglucosamine 1-carboxyvinyltransferase